MNTDIYTYSVSKKMNTDIYTYSASKEMNTYGYIQCTCIYRNELTQIHTMYLTDTHNVSNRYTQCI